MTVYEIQFGWNNQNSKSEINTFTYYSERLAMAKVTSLMVNHPESVWTEETISGPPRKVRFIGGFV